MLIYNERSSTSNLRSKWQQKVQQKTTVTMACDKLRRNYKKKRILQIIFKEIHDDELLKLKIHQVKHSIKQTSQRPRDKDLKPTGHTITTQYSLTRPSSTFCRPNSGRRKKISNMLEITCRILELTRHISVTVVMKQGNSNNSNGW